MSKEEALAYHSKFPSGKLSIKVSKSMETLKDLSLAYSPHVADACLEIAKNPEDAFKYTSKRNLVAVISNGTAVLGLGDIGPLASKPVMEGKAALFKLFSGIDSFDIELDSKNIDEIVNTVKCIAPTFGGINLEDFKGPDCFEIEERLIELLDIPVFHDDQHGTAVISTAALKNALEIQNKKIEDIKTVVFGAGAGAVACANLMIHAGLKRENVFMFDSKGLITKDRKDLNKYKEAFAQTKNETIEEVMKGCDFFLGLSSQTKDFLTDQMVLDMAPRPIILALANPNPEITPHRANSIRNDVVVATGRSDYPNQVNNSLCFPHIFRGALDVGATKINIEMKLACVEAIANLAKEPVEQKVLDIYGLKEMKFGPDYIIPKQFDRRLFYRVSRAVAQTAIDTGVAKRPIDMNTYDQMLDAWMKA